MAGIAVTRLGMQRQQNDIGALPLRAFLSYISAVGAMASLLPLEGMDVSNPSPVETNPLPNF